MSAPESAPIQCDTFARTRSEMKKLQSASMEVMASLAPRLAQEVTLKISALMDMKLTKLQVTLEGIITGTTKRITEAESRISNVENYATSLRSRLSKKK